MEEFLRLCCQHLYIWFGGVRKIWISLHKFIILLLCITLWMRHKNELIFLTFLIFRSDTAGSNDEMFDSDEKTVSEDSEEEEDESSMMNWVMPLPQVTKF